MELVKNGPPRPVTVDGSFDIGRDEFGYYVVKQYVMLPTPNGSRRVEGWLEVRFKDANLGMLLCDLAKKVIAENASRVILPSA